MTSLRLRAATRDDASAVRQLVTSCLAEFGLDLDPEGTDADLEALPVSYDGGRFDVLVDDDDRVVGSVGLMPVAEGVVELRKMYLRPELRGHGQGRRLLDHAIDQARRLGARRIELETASVLEQAIRLYQAVGFRPQGRSRSCRCDQAWSMDLD